MAFVVGDTVRLKSGGPVMTVEKVLTPTAVTCTWFNQEGHVFTIQHAAFAVAALEKHTTD